jgi:TrmH family RNA methyltransferase
MAPSGVDPPIATRIVLVRPLQPGNVGAVARVMANFGLRHLVLVDPPAYDPDQARWMAPGATEWVDQAILRATVPDALEGASTVFATTTRQRRWRRAAIEPEEAAERLLAAGASGAILFGPEDTGLTSEDLALADDLVTIPTQALESLNLSHAVAVLCRALLEAARTRGDASPGVSRQGSRGGGKKGQRSTKKPPPPARVESRVRLVDEALQALGEVDSFESRPIEQVRATLFDILGRAQLSEKEAAMFIGMVKKIRRQRST